MSYKYKKIILKNGKTKYEFDIDAGMGINGKRKRTKRRFDTVKEGKEYAAKLCAGVVSSSSRDALTFSQLFSLYIADQEKRLSPKSISNIRSIYRTHLSCFDDMRIDRITSPAVEEWAASLPGVNRTVNIIVQRMHTIMKWAVDHELIERNPVKFRYLKEEDKEMDYLTAEEFEKVYECMNPNYQLALLVLFFTGLRKEELCGLSAMDLENHELHLHHVRLNNDIVDTFKTKKSKRIVPIPPWLEPRLEEAFAESQYPFYNCYGSTFCHWLSCAVEKAGIGKHITPHCLRHSYAAMMINEGIEIYTLSKLMGHTKIATTMNRYGHLYDEKRREVSKLLDTKWSKSYNMNEKNVLN